MGASLPKTIQLANGNRSDGSVGFNLNLWMYLVLRQNHGLRSEPFDDGMHIWSQRGTGMQGRGLAHHRKPVEGFADLPDEFLKPAWRQ